MNTHAAVIAYVTFFLIVLAVTVVFVLQKGSSTQHGEGTTKWKLDCSAPRGEMCTPDPNGTYDDDSACKDAIPSCGNGNSYCTWADDNEQGITGNCDDKGPGYLIQGNSCVDEECSKVAMEATYQLNTDSKMCMRCSPDVANPDPRFPCAYTGNGEKTGYEICQEHLNSIYSGCVNGECVQRTFPPGTTPPSGWTKGFECSTPCTTGNGWCWNAAANACQLTTESKCPDGSTPQSTKTACCASYIQGNGCVTCDSNGNVQKLCSRFETDASKCDESTKQCVCQFPETCNESGPFPMNPNGGSCDSNGCVGCILQGSAGNNPPCTSNVEMPFNQQWSEKCIYNYVDGDDYMVCPDGGDCVLGTPITGTDDNDKALQSLYVCVSNGQKQCKPCSEVYPNTPNACCRYYNTVTTDPTPPHCYDPYDKTQSCHVKS